MESKKETSNDISGKKDIAKPLLAEKDEDKSMTDEWAEFHQKEMDKVRQCFLYTLKVFLFLFICYEHHVR